MRSRTRRLSPQDARPAQLHAILGEAQARFRLREAAWLAPSATALGVGATAGLALIWRLSGALSLVTLLWAGALLLGAAVLTASLYALLRPRDPMQTARQADHLLSLDERLATALEAAPRLLQNLTPVQIELRSAQLGDALSSATSISMSQALPLKLDARRLIPAGLLAVLLAVVVFVPNPLTGEDGAVRAQITQEQKKIEAIEEAVKSTPRLAQDPNLQALLKQLSELSSELKESDLRREEALARLSEAESKLQKTLDAQAKAQRAALDELATQLAGSGSEVAKEIGQALKSGDAQRAADALKEAGADSGKMPAEERKALADALKQARDNISSLDPEMARRLNEAAEALAGSDPQAAQKALDELGQKVAETGQKLATQEQIAQALAQLQQSKQNIARAGQAQTTPQPGNGTAIAQGQLTPQAGNGNANGTPGVGTPVTIGSPAQGQGQLPGTGTPLSLQPLGTASPGEGGTPVAVQGTPGAGGTAVTIPGQGQGGQQGGQGNVPGAGNPGGQGSGANQGWGMGHQEPVYAPPSSLSATLTPVVVQGQTNPGGEQGVAPINGGTTAGQAQVPYEQVYAEYREQASAALDSDYIPQGYKDLVRDYFSELEPDR